MRVELAPWDSQTSAVQSRLDVATAEQQFLLKKQADAQQQYKVRMCFKADKGLAFNSCGNKPTNI